MSQVFTRAHRDPMTRALTFERIQDVEPILERNKALQNTPQTRAASFRHVGTVPNVLIEKWMKEEGAPVLAMDKHEFARFIRRKLNDPDYAFLRTSDGRI